MAYPVAKLQPNEHGIQVPTHTVHKQIRKLRADGFKIEAISYPLNGPSIIIWYYWAGKRPTQLPSASFAAELAPNEKMIRVPKKQQQITLYQLQGDGHRILAVDYDDKGKGRIWFAKN